MSLTPETEALFSSAREALAPTEEERSRNLAALLGKVGAASAGAASIAGNAANGRGTAGAGGAKAAGVAAKAGVAATASKVALPLILAAALGSSAWWATNHSAGPGSSVAPAGSVPADVGSAPVRVEVAAPAAPVAPEAPNADVVAGEPATPPPTRAAPPIDSSERAAVRRPAAHDDVRSKQPTIDPSAVAPSEAPPLEAKSAPSPKPRLREELALVERIHAAQRQGNHAEVHALAGEYERRFPDGVLREEARASEVIAACTIGSAGEASSRARGFRERYPSSPLLPRVTAACTK